MAFVLDEQQKYILPREEQVDPQLRLQFVNMANDFFGQTGKPLIATDSFRSDAEQADVYRRKPNLASPPGKSRHNVSGLAMALDLDQSQVPEIEKLGLLEKYGFVRPVLSKGETWHIEQPRESASSFVLDEMPTKPAAVQAEAAPAASNFVLDTMKQVAQPEAVQVNPDDVTDTTSATLSQFAAPAGEAVGEAVDLPFKYLLRKPLGYLHEKVIEPQRERTEKEFAEAPPEFLSTAPEAFAPLPSKEVFVPTMEMALAGPMIKGLSALGRYAGLRLPTGTVAGQKLFKEPELAELNWANQIKQAQGRPVITESIPPAETSGLIPAAATPIRGTGNLSEKYGELLSQKDTSPSILGKFDVEVPVRGFQRLERETGAAGLKEDLYWQQKDLSTASKVEYDQIEKASREVEAALSKDAGRRIYNYAIGQQEGGPEILARMKEAPVTELVGPESAAYQQMRQGFDNLLDRWNEARVAVGRKPIEGVDNYFTFIRKYMEIVGKGGDPLRVDPRYFKPLDVKVPYEIQRAESNLPLVMDAFKVYRRYTKSVLDYIYQAPHTAEVRNLAKTVREAAPNTANFLDNWADQVMGLSKMKNPLTAGESAAPTTWLGKSVDWTVNKLTGVRPIEEGMDRAADKLINNVGVSTLSGYFRSAMVQPSSMVLATGEVGPVNMLKGIKDSAIPSRWTYAKQHSSVLSTREYDVNVAESIERMLSESKLGKLKRGAAEVGYAPLHYLDQQAAMATWWGAYRRGLSSGMEPGKELFRYADDVVIKTQGSAAKGDLARIQTHTLGKALTQFQTFVINEWGYLTDIVPGLKSSGMTFREKLAKLSRVTAAAGLANLMYEDVLGMPSPLPTPVGAAGKALREGRGAGGALMEAGKELGQVMPVLGGARYTGGSPFGPVAQFGTDVAASLKGEPSRVPLWTVPLRLRGVPGTVQLERLSRVPGKLSLGEALFGKMQPDHPVSVERKPSRKQVLESQSYIKDLFPDLDLGF